MNLNHIQQLVVKHAGKGQGVWSFLRVRSNDEERGIILLREELQVGMIFKGVDLVLLCKVDGVGLLEHVLWDDKIEAE